jgi:hypothetical protein
VRTLVADERFGLIESAEDALVVEEAQLPADLVELALERDQQFAVVDEDSLQALVDRSDCERANAARQCLSGHLPFH